MNIKRPWIYYLLLAYCTWENLAQAEDAQPRTTVELFSAIDRATAKGDTYGTAYTSSIISLNPCLDAERVLGIDFDHGMVEQARKVLPPHGCEDPTFNSLLPRLFILQALTLAQTDEPVRVQDAIKRSRKTLQSCRTVRCGVVNLEKTIPEFSREWETLQATAGAQRGGVSSDSRPVTDPRQWLQRYAPSVLKQVVAWCGDAKLVGAISHRKDDASTADFSCDLGGVNAPSWMLEPRGQGWALILSMASTIGVTPLKTTQSARHPDLKSAVRANMGEHPATVYRYDGNSYVNILQLDVQHTDFGEAAIVRIVD